MEAVGEGQKIVASEAMKTHVLAAQAERDFYRECTVKASGELKEVALKPPPVLACPAQLKYVH